VKKKLPIHVFIVFAAISAILLITTLAITPLRTGDGHEYALTLEAFTNHGTPAIKTSDVESLREYAKQYQQIGYSDEILGGIHKSFLAKKNCHGIFRSKSGLYFGYHFWFYPLFVLPAKLFLRITGFNELKAFQLANVVLIILAIAYILFISRFKIATRYVLIFGLFSSGIIYYIKWSHPEIFSTALLLIGCVAIYDRRYLVAILTSVLASWQNPPIAFIIPIIIYKYFQDSIANGNEVLSRRVIRACNVKLLLIACIACLTFIPSLFYFKYYGSLNLIVATKIINLTNISFERLLSLFFDLNQGLVLAMPAFLFIAGFLLFRNIWIKFLASLKTKRVDIIIDNGWLIIIALIMSLGASSTSAWNSGQTVLIRYAIWIAVPILFWVVLEIENISRRKQVILYCVIFIVQYTTMLYFLSWSKLNEDAIYLKTYVTTLWEYFPKIYSPDPDIFGTRVLGNGQYWKHEPVVFSGRNGDYRKILFKYKNNPLKTVNVKVCGENGIIYNINNSEPANVNQVDFKKNNWAYLSGLMCCKYSLPLTINIKDINPNIKINGFSGPEKWGAWTDGNEASITIPLAVIPKSDILLKIKSSLNQIESCPHREAYVDILVNDVVIAETIMTHGFLPVEHNFIIPLYVIERSDLLSIKFNIKNPLSPKEVYGSRDSRRLGIGIWSIHLECLNLPVSIE
jgi:hypothetical protein